jgi:hypothetical protein
MDRLKRCCILAVLLLAAGCAPTLQISAPQALEPTRASLAAEQPERFWWRFRFKLDWPEGSQPDFSRHLLIAEQLYLPAIKRHEDRLVLWRFHRRAGRDGAGNQFSLIFFADEATADAVDQQISGDPLTGWLLEREMIEKTLFGKQTKEELGRLEQSSDPNWPIEIQRSWPYFIMGASQSWLVLIQELSADPPLEGSVTYDQLLEHYRDVDVRLTAQWREYGQHTYLHHLSAVFGYEPIRLRASELRRF